MATENLTVAGRRFHTQADYQAALRDQHKIEAIKAQTNLNNPKQVYTLYGELQSSAYRFESMVGNDFDDEIYEKVQALVKRGITEENAENTALSGAKQARKSKSRKIKEAKPASPDKRKTGKSVSLDNYDSDMQKQILIEIKKREKRRRLLVISASLMAVLCFGYFGIYYYYMARTGANYTELAALRGKGALTYTGNVAVHRTSGDTPDIMEEFQALYQKNKKLIGWLQIDDTIINYPVMQTNNNEYYLTYNFNQEYDKNGSIFLDAECSIYPRSTNLILYGHHMKSGQMFGQLQKYAKEDYYKEHPLIKFDTLYEKGIYEIMYVFRSQVYNENDIIFKYYQFFNTNSEAEFNSNMSEMAEMSLYDTGITASYGDSLLTLSTCDNSQEDGRFVVVAKKGEFQ